MKATKPTMDSILRTLIRNTAHTLRGVQVFDTAGCWDQVQPVLHDPAVVRELDWGMKYLCEQTGQVWEPARGPWYYSSLPWRWVPGLGEEWDKWLPRAALTSPAVFEDWLTSHQSECQAWLDAHRPPPPPRNSPRWYQCFGNCGCLVAWQHAIAERLWPEHLWKICPCEHPLAGFHYLVLGWPRKRKGYIRVFDVLWQPYWLRPVVELAGHVTAKLIDKCAA